MTPIGAIIMGIMANTGIEGTTAALRYSVAARFEDVLAERSLPHVLQQQQPARRQ